MLAAGAAAWLMLPPDARIAVHWSGDGTVNGYAHKTFGLFFGPGFALALSVLFAVITRIDPRGRNLEDSRELYVTAWLAVLGVLAVAQGVIIATAFHVPVDVGAIVSAAVAVLFLLIGNVLGKSRPNFFAGVRTPWTLSSDYAWQRSNRLAGRMFMAAGVVVLVAIPFLPRRYEIWTLLIASLSAILVPTAMSYVYWRRDPERDARGAGDLRR